MKVQGRCRLPIFTVLSFFMSSTAGAAMTGEAIAGEYIVKLKNQTGVLSMQAMQPMAQAMNAQIKEVVSRRSNTVLLQRSIVETPESVVADISRHPDVLLVEPNYIYHALATPNDLRLEDLWGLINKDKAQGGVDIDAKLAWDITQGSRDVVVGVIDTGVNYDHPDLINNMWVNEAEKNGQPGVDDDGNGYVDDIHGYDFANDDGDPMDDNNHGSHVAGTIGAEGDNGQGVVGVNWQVSLMALKFLRRTGGGSLDNAIRAIDYAVEQKVDVLNNSWGGGSHSQLLKEAIERAEQAGVLFVVAAGNSRGNNDTRPMYPANYEVDNIISVAAVGDEGRLASFSNYGAQKVHVAAPGVSILSTGKSGYRRLSGTSMAAPHVSGIAALLLAQDKSLIYQDLKERILQTSVPHPSLNGKVSHGLVNALNALTNTLPRDNSDPSTWNSVGQNISTAHPYVINTDETYTVTVPGATKVAVYFDRFELESGYDYAYFYDAQGTEVGSMTGTNNGSYSPVVDGDTIVIKFISDHSVNRYGFDITKAAYLGGGQGLWKPIELESPYSTPHPYSDSQEQEFVIEEPGVRQLRVRFGRFETESGYDYVSFYDAQGNRLDRWSGNHTGKASPVVSGDKIIIRFRSDSSHNDYGFDIEAVEYR